MIIPTRWIYRKFNFDFPASLYPTILERLRYTPLRVRTFVLTLPEKILEIKTGDACWSIKERIGHITDVESLWESRLLQFLSGDETLIAADMSNKKTTNSNHNNKSITELLDNLDSVRSNFMSKLEKLTEADAARTALHPRLNKPMRLVDMLYFVAEHDDNELALMRYWSLKLL